MGASRAGPAEADGSTCAKRRRTTVSRAFLLLLLAATASLGHAGSAGAREYLVGACQADRFNFSTRAFGDFATRGMKIKRACDPEGPGLRGLITANVSRRGSVRRGARAILTLRAPAGTRFVRFRWSGSARRRDCRYALQLWADGPGIRAIPIKNVRANRRCPRRGHAQSAGFSRPRTYKVPGANRIVQRVVCVGSRRARRCSARGINYLRTRKAIARIADVTGPSVSIAPNTPLARGQWVRGTQGLNYAALDNLGVRQARALLGGSEGRDNRPCALAGGGAFAIQVPCPNGTGHIDLDTNRAAEGTHPLVVGAIDTAGNPGFSRAITARVDNTPPARVDVGVIGGDAWRNTNGFALAWTNPTEGDRAPIVAATHRLCRLGGSSCSRATRTGINISTFGVAVPGAGQWTVSLWRRDAAGN
jgi:hypothetical protein